MNIKLHSIKSIVSALFIICALQIAAQGQSEPPEYGNISEVKGMRKVYVFSEDLEAREVIVKALQEAITKKKIDAEIVGEGRGADLWVIYGSGGGMVNYRDTIQTGELIVSVRGAERTEKRPDGTPFYNHRFVCTTTAKRAFSSGITFQRSPHKKAIKRFIEQWSKLQKQK